MTPKTNACTGKCCVVFNYSCGIPTLQRRADYGDAESQFLVDMLIELSPDEAYERATRFDIAPRNEALDLRDWCDRAPVYTCRHWDEETGLCGVYEDRPRMCRDFPYGRRCDYDCNCSFIADPDVFNSYAAASVRRAVEKAEEAAP